MKNIFVSLLLLMLYIGCSKDQIRFNEDHNIRPPRQEINSSTDGFLEPSNPIESEPIFCQNGYANGFPCLGIDLFSQITLSEFGSNFANDNWGWMDRETGKEYVIQGLNDGTAFIDISDPLNPIFLGKLPTATENSTWRDIKVYKNHAFIVSEANNHGLQVFDLTRLRGLNSYQSFTEDARLTTFGSAHNIAINEDSGFAYVIGSQSYSGGPIFIDISDPQNPIEVGGYRNMGYSHDAQVVIYHGPDENYKDKEIFIGSNSDGGSNNRVVIVDVTDKEIPELITTKTYGNSGYAHQSWLSSDHRYLFFGDELDEYYYGHKTKTLVFDISNLDSPNLYFTYEGTTNAIDHNGYVVGNKFYLSNYTAGLRVMDISQIDNKVIDEIAFFDTYPESDIASFDGVWNVYPFFQSGIIAIGDGLGGLFLVKTSE